MQDSREKIEEDVREWASTRLLGDGVAETVIGWLDRQDAITQCECIDRWDARATLETAELTEQVDKLKQDLAERNGAVCERDGLSAAELPDDDAVAVLRKVANSGEVTGNAICKEVGGVDWADALLILADMVERDYVRRDETNAIASKTNGITSDSPLVELPDGDAPSEFAEILMQLAADCSCMGDGIVRHFEPKDVQDDVDALMRVVERDYVLRSIFDAVCDQRDEWKAKAEDATPADGLTVLNAIDRLRRDLSGYHGQLKAHNDLQRHCDNQRKRISTLEELYSEAKTERDYWRDQFKECLMTATSQARGENLDKLMTYPKPDDVIEPYQLVTDEIDSLRDFYAEEKRRVDELEARSSERTCKLDGYTDAAFKVCQQPDETDFTDYAEVCECTACGASIIVPHSCERISSRRDELWPIYTYCPNCGAKVVD